MKNSPHILIFSTGYFPLVGGAEIAVREITDRIQGYNFDLITARFSKENAKREKIGNITVYRVGFGTKFDKYLLPVLGYFKAKKLHKKNKYSLIWSISVSQAGLAALFFKLISKLPFLLTIQEGSSKKRLFCRRWMVWLLIRKIFKKADYIQAISKFLADFSKEMGAKCPIEVVPNGVDTKQFSIFNFQFSKKELKRELGIREGEKVIITVSRLVEKNGVEDLIKSLKYLKDFPVKLLIVGDGPLHKRLKLRITDYGLQNKVLLLGLIKPEDVPKYLAISDVFVRPSISEGFGNVFVEAMAAGLPVIGTPVGGIPDFLVDYNAKNDKCDTNDANGHANATNDANDANGRIRIPRAVRRGLRFSHATDKPNGLFAKPRNPKDLAEKIKQLLEDENLRKKLGENGRRLVEEKYDWNIIAKKMKSIFDKFT